MHLDHSSQQLEVEQNMYIYQKDRSLFRIQGCHSLVCNAVATFWHGCLLLRARCGCRLQNVDGGPVEMFCHECLMVLRC